MIDEIVSIEMAMGKIRGNIDNVEVKMSGLDVKYIPLILGKRSLSAILYFHGLDPMS